MEKIVILDFGSQYTQVIARRIRECAVFSEILPHHTAASRLADPEIKGIILSGGPASVYARRAPRLDPALFDLGKPVLGICYGMQLMAYHLGGEVAHGAKREYGPGVLRRQAGCRLFSGLPREMKIWNSHGDKLTRLPRGFRAAARSENSEYAAIEDAARRIYGLQFHPEVHHTPLGKRILENFVHRLCGCGKNWTARSFIEQACDDIRARVGRENVILGLSGGVDSSVAAALLHRAIGRQLTCVFVNNGLLRKHEAEGVRRLVKRNLQVRLHYVDAAAAFLRRLRGVTDPERKRKIIGHEFIRVFERATEQLRGTHRFLAQGTLYPDVIESIAIGNNPAALIKSHHNVGGLPKRMKFRLVEPLRQLFKDEVRRVGDRLGLPREVVWRQPFPGPGLAVRCLGEITEEKLRVLRDADEVVVDEMKKAGLYYKVWQTFAVLLPVKSVGVMGDERTYENAVALRAVESQDAMTADWVRAPYDLLAKISNRIINEVQGVNRVVLDITSKPPGTIEWE
ncbi:MAG: glutamine-hydrolyzing GMP synthase [Verrucomicrobiae bacterium]|nr:glutamine-hydrolyzing GMP synthase [Verrucomicrobiae bacterium]